MPIRRLSHHCQRLGCLVLVVWAVVAAVPQHVRAEDSVRRVPSAVVANIPITEITAGMTGYGLTVLEGTRVDTFAVTVLGVQRRTRAAGDVIIVELAGHGLELSAVAQGMSGSPIYLDGRFAGAVAFGWAGALRPIAGVTPAAELLALPTAQPPTAEDQSGRLTRSGDALALVNDRYPQALAADLLGPDATGHISSAPHVLPADWPEPTELLADLLPTDIWAAEVSVAGATGPMPLPIGWIYRPLASGTSGAAADGGVAGGGADAADVPLVPGAACAVPLIVGDAQLGALGTVTWVDGDRVLMFGHPFMQRGPVQLPLASARIVSVFPSRQMSFKIGSIGPVIGSVLYDQRAGLVGQMGVQPRLIPVTVRLQRPAGEEAYAFEVADDPTLSPLLVFWCLYNALLVHGDDQSRQTLRYEITTTWAETTGEPLAPVVLSGQVAGPGGAAALGSEWMAPLQILLNNRHTPLDLQRVAATMTISRPLEAAVIAAATVPGGVRSGETVPVGVTLQPYRGEAQQVTLSLELPAHVAPGKYRLAVANARDFFALETERAAGLFEDRTLAATLALIRTPRSAATLMAVLLGPPRSVVVAGRELTHLPGSVAHTLQAGRDGVTTPTRAAYIARTDQSTDLYLQGYVVREIQVLPPAKPIRQESRP